MDISNETQIFEDLKLTFTDKRKHSQFVLWIWVN